MEYLRIILNNALYLSLLVIIISSIIGVFIAGRKRDSCLKDFNNDECRLELINGKTIYGTLRACGSGIEMEYVKEHRDDQGHSESSFILYTAESGQIKTIKRLHGDLSMENREDRIQEIKAAYHPSFLRITRRKVRNFFNTFQDGLSKSLTTIIGAVATKQEALAPQKKELSGLGTQVIGAVSHSYNSILERYIGHYVVMEMPQGDNLTEYCGILKQYSQNYLEILNVIELKAFNAVIDLNSTVTRNEWFEVQQSESEFRLKNISEWPIYVDHLLDSSKESSVGKVLGVAESLPLPSHLSRNDGSTLTVYLTIPEVLDMIVPRTNSTIRHGCPRSKHTLETMLGLASSQIVQRAIFDQFTDLIKARESADPDEKLLQG